MTAAAKLWAFLLLTLLAVVTVLFLPPIPQPATYHHFADARTLWGIPNALNVLSNLPFLLAGIWGLLVEARANFLDSRERMPYGVLFAGVALTAFGSAWYHLAPDNDRLVWDRLPITVGFMGFFAAVISERLSLRAGRALLWPLVAAGIASVFYWRWTEMQGSGDLRWYLLVQLYPLLAIPLLMALFSPRYTAGRYVPLAIALYIVAKVFELADGPVLAALHFVSGHTLKHLAAAAASACLVHMVAVRSPIPVKPC
jgi:hypothetical protein